MCAFWQRFDRADLRSGFFLWGVRIGRLYNRIAERGATMEAIAAERGISARTLRTRFGRSVGLPPRVAVRELDAPEVAQRLIASMTRR